MIWFSLGKTEHLPHIGKERLSAECWLRRVLVGSLNEEQLRLIVDWFPARKLVLGTWSVGVARGAPVTVFIGEINDKWVTYDEFEIINWLRHI